MALSEVPKALPSMVELILPTTEVYQQEPKDVHDWLLMRGWYTSSTCPNTDTQFYKHTQADPEDLMYTWVEAVAYEMFRFMNIGRT